MRGRATQDRRGPNSGEGLQYSETRFGAFESDGELGRVRPSADGEDLPADFPNACIAPLNDVGRVRQRGAERIILFAGHGAVSAKGRAPRPRPPLELDCVLEFAQAVELLLGETLLVVVRVCEVLFGVLDLLAELLGAELFERNRRLGEKNDAVLAGVGEAAAHEDATVLAMR